MLAFSCYLPLKSLTFYYFSNGRNSEVESESICHNIQTLTSRTSHAFDPKLYEISYEVTSYKSWKHRYHIPLLSLWSCSTGSECLRCRVNRICALFYIMWWSRRWQCHEILPIAAIIL